MYECPELCCAVLCCAVVLRGSAWPPDGVTDGVSLNSKNDGVSRKHEMHKMASFKEVSKGLASAWGVD